jgi:hypothetical protein
VELAVGRDTVRIEALGLATRILREGKVGPEVFAEARAMELRHGVRFQGLADLLIEGYDPTGGLEWAIHAVIEGLSTVRQYRQIVLQQQSQQQQQQQVDGPQHDYWADWVTRSEAPAPDSPEAAERDRGPREVGSRPPQLVLDAPPEIFDVRSDDPPEEAARPAPVARYLNATAPERVGVDHVFGLLVQIESEAVLAGPGSGSTAWPEGTSGRISLDVQGSGVEFPDGSVRELDVPPSGASVPVRFTVKARRAGMARLQVSAWNGAAYVAGLKIEVAVDTAEIPAAREASDVEFRPPEGGEYTLEIVYEAEDRRYRFQIRGNDIGVTAPEYSPPLIGDQGTRFVALQGSLNAQARNLHLLTPTAQGMWLRGMGTDLATSLVPAGIRATLWEIRDRIARLNILSQGDQMPWEILYVASPDETDGYFLADVAGAARWRYGPPTPASIRRGIPYAIRPDGSPAQTLAEIDTLRSLYPNLVDLNTMDPLLDLLTQGGFGMLHFASHNNLVAGNAGESYVPFAGGSRFTSTLMGGLRRNLYRADRPLVFMNACTSAGAAPLITDVSSWADRYLSAGTGAFVGSLWEVRDRSAPAFAQAFHERLASGGTLGEAMKAGRDSLGPNDPTRLAYTLYGNPSARLES